MMGDRQHLDRSGNFETTKVKKVNNLEHGASNIWGKNNA
jgi:hypothetical protein